MDEDPELYMSLSKRLEQILKELKENWAEIEKALIKFITELKNPVDEVADSLPLPGETAKEISPFFKLIKAEVEKRSKKKIPTDSDEFKLMVKQTINIVNTIKDEITTVGFWRDKASRAELEKKIWRILVEDELMTEKESEKMAPNLVALAKTRHRFMIK
jgi:type I restriction enzyme R subunit